MSEAQEVDEAAVQLAVLARHLAWERSMQAAVAHNLDEHRGQGHTVVILRDGKIVSLGPVNTDQFARRYRVARPGSAQPSALISR